jgi:hypothetical protein
MLGRGVTIPGLALTYITREAKNDTNADTVEQRARWFGYKRAYLDVCRIFLTDHLSQRYSELLRHEDDFWEALVRNEEQRLPVRDWPRMFSLDMETWKLRPTRTSVAKYRQFRGRKWDEQKGVIADAAAAAKNIAIINEFFERNPWIAVKIGPVTHHMVRDCPVDRVVTSLLARLDMTGTGFEKEYVEEYLERLLLGGRLGVLDVVRMAEGHWRVRSLKDGHIVQLMQGRTPGKHEGDSGFYPGDDNIHGGKVQLQLHLLRVSGAENSALALYIPPDPQYDLRAVVREEHAG